MKLAIKGHSTRGKEVIEILEMLGGKNDCLYRGNVTDYAYIINEKGIINWCIPHPNSPLVIFTLEEFLEKYPYKIRDKVNYIKYNDVHPSAYTIQRMRWTGVTIEYLLDSIGFSALTKDLQPYKEETMEEKIDTALALNLKLEGEDYSDRRFCYKIPNGYEIDCVREKEIILKPKPQYPKTYEECCKILNWNHRDYDRVGYNSELLCKLQVLILCRDAYWKIAGKEMGLDKPWEPDWTKKHRKVCYLSLSIPLFNRCRKL